MNKLKHYLQSIRQHSSTKTLSLEQELDAIREAHAGISSELEKVHKELLQVREQDAQLLAELHQQLKQIDSERYRTREQIEHLTGSLADLEQYRKSTEGRVDSLETRLKEEISNAREQVAHVQGLLADTEQNRKSTEGRVDALETRLEEEISSAHEQVMHLQGLLMDTEKHRKSTQAHVGSLETRLEEEHNCMRDQVAQVQRLLTDAEQNLKTTEGRVGSLEIRHGENRSRYEAKLHATEASLARIQEEHQSMLLKQSRLSGDFQGITTRLQDLQQAAGTRSPQSRLMSAVITGVLLVAGVLAGVFIMQGLQDRSQELAMVEQDIRDMRGFMKERIDRQDAALNDLALTLNRDILEERTTAMEAPVAKDTVLPEENGQPPERETFTPDIRELQAGLITLGYDLGTPKPNGEPGVKTRQALQEFRQFYFTGSDVQDNLASEPLVAQVLNSADAVRRDAARFNIRRDVLAAIRLGSMRTGVDFSFLMEVARVESNFNPAARAPHSTATGLFQFRDHAWLESIRTFGADYGLQDYASRVELIDSADYTQERIVRDPLQLEVLALRLNPRLSTLMMAESIKRNLQNLSERIGLEPGRTELYLAHFLGTDSAVVLLDKLDQDPAASAADLFPQEAELNPGVFLNPGQQPRSVGDVYRRFERKFDTGRYGESNPG